MYKKIICSKCGFIYFISNEGLIEIDNKMYSQCGLCSKLNLYKIKKGFKCPYNHICVKFDNKGNPLIFCQEIAFILKPQGD